jgi:hypothetical protein
VADDGQQPRRVRRAHRVAVHRGAVERREVGDGVRVGREDTTGRVADRHLFGRKRASPFEHELQRFADTEQVAHRRPR